MTDDAAKDTFLCMDMDENKNIFTSYPAEVDRHVSFLTAFEDDVIGADHPFLGHECDKDLVGGHLGFGTYDLQKCFTVGNISSALEYDEIINGGAVDSTLNVGEEVERELFNGMLPGADERILREQKLLQYTSNDRSLDNRSVGTQLTVATGIPGDSHFRENSELVNESLDSSRRDTKAGMSEVSAGRMCVASGNDKSAGLFDKMTVEELQKKFRVMFGRETVVVDKHWLKRRLLFGMQNNIELEEHLNPGRYRIVSHENEVKNAPSSACTPEDGILVEEKSRTLGCTSLTTSLSELTETGTSSQDKGADGALVLTGKRHHKPPRRYIEESMDPKSSIASRRRSCTNKKESNVKPLGVKPPKQAPKQSPKQLSRKSVSAAVAVPEEEPFNGACIQVPFGLPVEEEHEEETPSPLAVSFVSSHDSENCPSNQSTISNERSDAECLSLSVKLHERISKADCEGRTNVMKGKRRRKHHIPWTQSEVMKLIEGVSHLGVGRWSKIKKLLFSSSKHRTSVDLKDKWRNLVKASCMQLRKKKKGVQGMKQLTHQAPEAVLRRVRELANSFS